MAEVRRTGGAYTRPAVIDRPTRRGVLRALVAAPFAPALLRAADGPPATFLGEAASRGHRIRGVDPTKLPVDREERTAALVVGAGMAGLAAAHALRARGVEDLLVVELDDVVGGLAQRRRVGGMSVSFGPQALDAPSPATPPEVAALLYELGGGSAGTLGPTRRPRARRRVDGAWIEGDPDGSWGRLLGAVARAADRIARVAKTTPRGLCGELLRRGDATSAAEWCARELPDDAGALLRTSSYARARFGMRAEHVSAGALTSDLLRREEMAEGLRIFPPGGVGAFAERLAEGLGARLRFSRVVLRVARDGDGVRAHVLDPSTNYVTVVRARAVVAALPPYAAREVAPELFADGRGADLPETTPWVQSVVGLERPPRDFDAAKDWHLPDLATPTSLTAWRPRPSDAPPVAPPFLPAGFLLDQRPFPGKDAAPARLQIAHETPWERRDVLLRDLDRLWPDLRAAASRVDFLRLGHGSIRPVPGFAATRAPRLRAPLPPFYPCGADWEGVPSVEAALASGLEAGRAVADALGAASRPASRPSTAPTTPR